MKKLVFLFALLVTHFLFAQTTVTQDITSHSTWNIAGSPYNIANSISVVSGAVLTIDPGVEVNFLSNWNLQVRGKLVAIGTVTDSIKFSDPIPMGYRGSIYYTGEIEAEYLIISSMNFGFYEDHNSTAPHNPNGPRLEVYHSRFDRLASVIHGSNVRLDSCLVENSSRGIAGENHVITHSIFRYNNSGIRGIEDCIVENCEFYGNGLYPNGSYGALFSIPFEVRNCIFRDNTVGCILSLQSLNATIVPKYFENNQLFDNEIGIKISRDTALITMQNLSISHNIICNDSLNLVSDSSGNPGPSLGLPLMDISNNCWCAWDSAAIAGTISMGSLAYASTNFMPFDSTCLPSLVFPGDANHDQVANNFDILPVGIHFNQSGPLRPSATLNWTGQQCPDWSVTQANGRDVKHADCDGNGAVDWADTLAIYQNYGLTHNAWKTAASNGNYILNFDMPTANILPGDTLSIPILLGNVDTPAVGMYGLAFSIQYDTMMIEPNSVRVSYDGSWLGTKNTDMLTLDKDFFLDGQTDLGLVRNDQMNRSGYGKIADLIVVISDDLAKRGLPLVLEFTSAIAVDSAGQSLDLVTRSGVSTIETNPTTMIDSRFAFDLKAFPNPAQDKLTLEHDAYTFTSMDLITLAGKKIPLWQGHQIHKLELDLPELPSGLYMLDVRMKEGRKVVKIEVK